MNCSVGSIVWVRRRNGSWWPGQILGTDDLSTSHLTSPRSGTPVKLLGREDASVDWYNLEKSKRVKSFRCGEFDDCIEKVESSHEMPLKKREKYARREDAILHALELERQLVKKQAKVAIASDRTSCRSASSVKKGLAVFGEINDAEKHLNLKSHVSCENEVAGDCFPLEVARDMEVDLCDMTPRTRGLQGFGIKIPPLKENLPSPVDRRVSQNLSVDEGAQALVNDSIITRSALQTNGARQISTREKKSRYFYFPSESSDSLEYKERLDLAEMSSPKLGGEFPYRGSLVGETESTFMDVESGSSETDSTVSDSDSSETEPDMEAKVILTETGRDFEEHESTSSEELDELAVTGDMPHLYPRELTSCHEAMSKWQLKGKRNSRNLVKRSYGPPDGKSVICEAEVDFEDGRPNLSHKRMGSSLHCYRNDFSDDALYDDDQMLGSEDEYSPTPRAVSKVQNRTHRGAKWNDLASDEHLASKEYWDMNGSTPTHSNGYHVSGRTRSVLINVDVKVQAGYRKEPVPIISLMSKLDGKAIIGHPIQVEVLKDGSSDALFSAIDDFSNDGIGLEESSVLRQGWSTARRTANFRVPRTHVFSSNGAEVAGEFPSLDQQQSFDYKKQNSGSSSHKASLQKKSGNKKFYKKAPKKSSLSSNQKIRTLSSLSIEHRLRNPLHDISSYQTDRLIKPEISGPTTVACIPVQLVFSRLLEKINRPPLKAALPNTGVERNS
ncbi:uncharacterized protein At1g51745-like [Vicia villosa]|uniref:uncharacterized protein At1g51745-like n=1 Tax=Vicia villosa TaxID=3911 RepID=UPI00273BF3D3|nr:uncharacterized protein At1g51745-like [Vicia villosa]